MTRVKIFFGFVVLMLLSPTASATVSDITSDNIPSYTYESGTYGNIVLKLIVQDSGSSDTLQSLSVFNASPFGTTYDANEPAEVAPSGVMLWIDPDGNTSNGMTSLGSFTVDGSDPRTWSITGLSQSVVDGDALIVTVDTQSSISGMRALQFHVPASGVTFTGQIAPVSEVLNADYQLLTTQNPAEYFQASLLSDITSSIGVGKTQIPLGTWNLESNPLAGHTNDADCYVTNLSIYLEGLSGSVTSAVDPSDIFSAIQVIDPNNPGTVYLNADSVYIAANQNLRGPGSLLLDLTATGIPQGALMSPGLPSPVQVIADIRSSVTVADQLRIRIFGPGDFSAFDINTGRPVTSMASPSFPLQTSWASIQAAANTMWARFSQPPSLTQVAKGSQGVTAFTLGFQNPGLPNTGNIQVKTVHFTLLDENGQPIVPNTLLSRVRVDDGVNTYLNRPIVESSGNTVMIQFSFPVNVSVANPITTFVRVDVKPDAIPNQVRFRVQDLSDPSLWKAVQANVSPEVVVQSFGNTPFATSLLPIVTALQAIHRSVLPSTLYQGQAGLPVMDLVLTHPGPTAVGNAVLNSVRFKVRDAQGTAITASQALAAARLTLPASTPAQSVSFSGDSFTVLLTQGVTIVPGASVSLSLQADLSVSIPFSSLRFIAEAPSDIVAVQPSEPGRTVSVVAGAGDSFPMSTASAPVQGGTPDQSLSNYPNPFKAGKEPTTFAYYLAEASQVSLKVYTLTGDPVRTLLEGSSQAVGGRSVTWDGRNERGRVVVNGVYVAVFEIESGGKTTKAKRMVAVLK